MPFHNVFISFVHIKQLFTAVIFSFIMVNAILLLPVSFLARYLIASHTTGYQNPLLFFNTLAVFVLVVAKFPNMHKVRIFGINADH